jgi:hypothetical protein
MIVLPEHRDFPELAGGRGGEFEGLAHGKALRGYPAGADLSAGTTWA